MRRPREATRRILIDRRLNVGQESIATVEPMTPSIPASVRAGLLKKATSRIRSKETTYSRASERKESATSD
jgi:hypothetical protein